MQSFTRFYYHLASILFVLLMPITANASVEIEKSAAIAIPPIIYSDESGQSHILDASEHKLTALHFWATWCKPCIIEFPQVDKAQKKYSKKGFNIIAISEDEDGVNRVKKFYRKHHIRNLDIFFDSNMSTLQKLKVRGLPTTIFINSDGKQIGRADGPIDWESEEIEKFIESQIGLSKK